MKFCRSETVMFFECSITPPPEERWGILQPYIGEPSKGGERIHVILRRRAFSQGGRKPADHSQDLASFLAKPFE